MKTIKIIDLLNKIANGEEVPKKIKYRNWLYEFNKNYNDYLCQYDSLLYRENDDVRQFLNDEVEILEEEKKITPTDFENLGYALGSIRKYINKGYDKAIEEKKIPERVLNAELFDVPKLNNMELSNIALTNKEDIKIIKDTLNKVLDYLKSKGE